jgi:hypothetical protein
MFGSPFYHSTLRKMMATFGTLFSNIAVVRRHPNGNEKERIRVPLAYGPAQKYLIKTKQDPNLTQDFAIKLPRMSFEIRQISYDAERKLNTIKVNTLPNYDTPNKVYRQYQGVPYNISVDLMIMSKNVDDANQIVEQIFPWFTPAYTVTIDSIPGMEYKDDVPITLRSVQMSDNYEGDFTARRDIVWTLSFDVRAWFYGPIKDKNLITKVQTDILATPAPVDLNSRSQLNAVPRHVRFTVEPSNPFATYNEDFGYTETTQHFDDQRRYDPKTGEDVPAVMRVEPTAIKPKQKVGRPKLI